MSESMHEIVTESEMGDLLAEALYEYADENEMHVVTDTFANEGLLTSNEGIVVKIDGHEFQITIVRSR